VHACRGGYTAVDASPLEVTSDNLDNVLVFRKFELARRPTLQARPNKLLLVLQLEGDFKAL